MLVTTKKCLNLNFLTTQILNTTFFKIIKQVVANELYLHEQDPLEVENVANLPMYKPLVEKLRKKLIAGWRGALPRKNNELFETKFNIL